MTFPKEHVNHFRLEYYYIPKQRAWKLGVADEVEVEITVEVEVELET
jgi:hypothetical protein